MKLKSIMKKVLSDTENEEYHPFRKNPEEILKIGHDIAKIAFWIYTEEGKKIHWNQGISRILECEEKDLDTLESFLTFVHEDDRNLVEEMNERVVQKKTYDII